MWLAASIQGKGPRMITTVTTAVAALVELGLNALFGVLVVAALLLLLAQRELVASAGHRLLPLARNLAVAIAPLAVLFAIITATRLAAQL